MLKSGVAAAVHVENDLHYRLEKEVKAGELLVVSRSNETIVAKTVCDSEQGFQLLDHRFREMRFVEII